MNSGLTRYARASIIAALATIVLKSAAYWLTGSVGLLSDAVESVVNVVGGIMAYWMLTVASKPADQEHAYGHDKAEYFSSGVEGGLIVIAAISIGWAAVPRLFHPQALEKIGVGLVVSVVASVVNLVVALWILRAGRRYQSITLEANARHLLTDVWTSVGVLVAVALVPITGWDWLDPVIALIVAANIVWTGSSIVRRSISGLMDESIGADDRARVEQVLERYRAGGVNFHAVMTRQSGSRRFVSMHVLVPGEWTVQRGHELAERIEADVRESLGNAHVITHLEPSEDPVSFEDETLERRGK
ncbi:ferrous-iron efflux pump FieF [mine drainage metagenome]|uniref:Ferrous-iron efflux pump FieF n=1 Tax=mine drainage metagenome TaxID=410659 RepID=A0A1J5T255_9ZZZZ